MRLLLVTLLVSIFLFSPTYSCIVKANPSLNIRSTASATASIVGSLLQGTTVSCLEKLNGFCRVGTSRWASAEYINCATTSSNGFDGKAPAADYTRKTWRGITLNQRTIEMIQRAEVYMAQMGKTGFQFSFSQGSYSSSVAASAGTHDGGGAVDIRTSVVNNDKKTVDTMVVALRKAGFAAWSRGRVADSFQNNKHIHAIAIGDAQASSGAKNQVASFKRGRNGLKGDGVDPDAYLGRAIPTWAK
ncbi:unnamed protein product [Rotaria socialis]|uniref:SH3b domain-containing protein n=1 Tax=Rotaria socialis TaxID=392032 RepID=A0A818AJB5_9BILA|nr:unnamed protein product [Rotaria socialis]CAF3404997.1 unnamed protein product [Rotaria socialis]CAF3471457.1 unnamed protein product [Rotaria socialis]CAF4189432.1 unnamed protein product [Rotaria socialis]CAF4240777.1 unnamed protein product [Rotaria socialis]